MGPAARQALIGGASAFLAPKLYAAAAGTPGLGDDFAATAVVAFGQAIATIALGGTVSELLVAVLVAMPTSIVGHAALASVPSFAIGKDIAIAAASRGVGGFVVGMRA